MPSPLILANDTLFSLTPLSGRMAPFLTPFSARGLTQTLELIKGTSGGGNPLGTQLRYDCNYNLVDLTDVKSRKYLSTVSCRDAETPALDDVWIGTICEVACVYELSYPAGATQQRLDVSGSLYLENGVYHYRPLLTMMVVDPKGSFQEYTGVYAWQILLAEV